MENVQLQLQTGFIDRLADNNVVTQRVTDGYFNATAMCRASGKLMGDYLRLSATKAFLTELSSDMGIPISGLVQSIRGGDPHLQGTWVHPQVAINLAQWLSPKFSEIRKIKTAPGAANTGGIMKKGAHHEQRRKDPGDADSSH